MAFCGLLDPRAVGMKATMDANDPPDDTIREEESPYFVGTPCGAESHDNLCEREATLSPDLLTAIGTAEGFGSALLTVLVFLVPSYPGTQELSLIVMITLMGLGMGLGIGGIRFGKGDGRVLAWCSVVVLSLLFFAFVGKSVRDKVKQSSSGLTGLLPPKLGKPARFRATSPHHKLHHPSTIIFCTPAALAKSSSVTSR